jgi:FixJ family two-component response regulator
MPIIFITGHGDIPMTVEAMKAGAVEFLTKPFTDEALLGAIRQRVSVQSKIHLHLRKESNHAI